LKPIETALGHERDAAVRVGGWMRPLPRELRELYYLQTTPVILDDAQLQAFLRTVRKTPYARKRARGHLVVSVTHQPTPPS
jgi:hypothetical protein